MGTTSEKLTYLNETKQELKQKINNLGGSIDDNTTFRQYANQLQNVYDNLPKTEYQEGTEVNLGKTIKGKLDYENGVVGIGQTEQDSTQGYNLLSNLPNTNTSANGVTLKTENNLITFSGSATETTYFNIQINSVTMPNSAIYIYLFNNFAEEKIKVTFRNGTTTISQISYNTQNKIFQSGSLTNSTIDNIVFVVESGNSNTGTSKLMLATSNNKSYEPYTGEQVSPSPSYPQQIKSVTGEQEVVVKDENNNITTTKTIDLGNEELCKIGTYQDYIYKNEGKWYKHSVIGKVVLNGNEDWNIETTFLRFSVRNLITDYLVSERATAKCNYYKYGDISSGSGHFALSGSNNYLFMQYPSETINTLPLFKTWLSTHNNIIYYILATPTDTEITDNTLIEQLEDIWNSQSNNGTTIIEVNGDLPMILKVRALKGE